MPYVFDSTLDISKALTFEPIADVDLSTCPQLPDDWIDQLVKLCELTPEQRDKHINPKYKCLEDLKSNLTIIYHRLAGNLDRQLHPLTANDRMAVILKIKEDVENCTEGFHNRVNLVVSSFMQPKSFLQLLFKIRMQLIEKVATFLTKEVHAQNHCYVIACGDGLGVKPIFELDPYRGSLSDDVIRTGLNKVFNKYYHSLHLPFMLCDALRNVFIQLGYVGMKAIGYDIHVYNNIKKYIELIGLCNSKVDFDAIFIMGPQPNDKSEERKEMDEEDEVAILAIQDINWHFVRQLCYRTVAQNLFIRDRVSDIIITPTYKTLYEIAQYSTIFSANSNLYGQEEFLIPDFSNSDLPAIESFVSQLIRIQADFPAYFTNLISTISVNTKINIIANRILDATIANAKQTLPYTENDVKQKFVMQIILCMHLVTIDAEYKARLKKFITEGVCADTNIFLMIAKFGQISSIKFLNVLSLHFKQFSFTPQELEKLFTITVRYESNKHYYRYTEVKNALSCTLSCATPEYAVSMFNFMCRHLRTELITKVLSEKTDYHRNALMLAQKYPQVLKLILDYLSKHIDTLAAKDLKSILCRYDTCLHVDKFTHADSIPLILEFLNKHHANLSSDFIVELGSKGNSILSSMIYQDKAIAPFLEFLTKNYIDDRTDIVRTILTTRSDDYGFFYANILISAVWTSHSATMDLLNFMSLHFHKLGIKTIQKTLVNSSHNVLELLALYKRTLDASVLFTSVIDFIYLHLNDFSIENLKDIFNLSHACTLKGTFIYNHVSNLFTNFCEMSMHSDHSHFTEKLLVIASKVLGRDTLCEIYLTVCHAENDDQAKIKYLKVALDKNTVIGNFFHSHHYISHNLFNSTSVRALLREIDIIELKLSAQNALLPAAASSSAQAI